ncbi:hypothetical protein CI109_104027 [Kwoniella shandongensis]|uniref:Uncharacterized protein n=1 Tax=Kwoniella shandongensis TaxID=1734106 RepID=A0AAJ8LLV2_9TREE
MSPTEELSEMSRSVAGWMPDAGHATFRLPSPSRSSRVNPYSYGADVPPHPMKMEDDRPVSQSGVWESRQPGYRPALPPQPARIAVSSSSEPQTQHPLPRFHPDPSGPPLGPAQRYIPPGYPDSPHYPPATQLPHVEGVTGHLTYLEEKIQRLAEVINEDRVEHVRYNLDFSSYLLQMVGWVAGDAPSPEMRVLKDTLNRQNENMRQRYEAFVASDALAFMASGGAGSRDRDDRAVPPSLHHLSPFPAHQPRPFHSTTLPDLRPPSSSHGLPPRRSSPALGYGTSSVNLKARSLDEGGREGSSSFPPPFLMSSRDSKPLSQPSVPPPSPGAGIRDNRDGGDGYGFGHGHGREQTGEDRREVGSSGGYRSDPERKPVIREEGSSVEGESTSVKRGGLKSLLN